MITEAILSLFFGFVDLLLCWLPALSWVVDSTVFDTFFNIVAGACYFLPMDTIGTILGIIISINLFRVAMALIKTILKFVPFI